MAAATPPAVCPSPMKATSNGSFQGDNPLDYALPLAILQICLVVVFTRLLSYALKPLRQPRVVAEIIGGILLGPSAFGRSEKFLHTVFPAKSMTVLDTLANIGLLYFLFLVGLELDIRAIRRTGSKALAIALAGITLPFVLGLATSVVLRATVSKGVQQAPFVVFMGVALSITAFPVLARILAELKLLTTDLGRIAMSAAAVNDVAAWVLLALAIALSGNPSSSSSSSSLVSVYVLLSAAAFVAFAIFFLRPFLVLMARRSPEGEPVKELYICIVLSMVLASGFVTDTIGIHALFGAFVMGIVVPKDGPFAGVLIEKIEDIVSGILLPLYFVSSGLKTNVATITGVESWALLALVIFTACFGKIIGTLSVAMAFKLPLREAASLGFLMNTKGLVELIVLNIGKDRKVLNDQTFAILVLMALFTTFITTPIVVAIYKPARKGSAYKHRTIQREAIPESDELRLLACFNSTRNIPSMINLIESSRGTRRGRLCVYAMHLMELSERSSAISMVHKARKNGLPFWNKKLQDTDRMVIAFEAYQQLSKVTVRPMTAISSFTTIHEDICNSALQKRVAMIVVPFHKNQRLDGVMESLGHSFHLMNLRVLREAPCSVGILVDRGLGGTTQVMASEVSYEVAVPFFGGNDDREAVSFALRMAEHPGIALTVVRFKQEGVDNDRNINDDDDDNEFFSRLDAKKIETTTMSCEERVVRSKEDIVGVLRSMTNKCNLFVVGRAPPTAALVERTDCPELGPLGSFLASSDFSTTASILVVQQYVPGTDHFRPLVTEETEDAYEPEPDTPRT